MSMTYTPRGFTTYANMQAAAKALHQMAAEDAAERRHEFAESKEARQRNRREARAVKHAGRFC